MKTIDVRLTFASVDDALAVCAVLESAARKLSLISERGILLDGVSACIKTCIEQQTRVRDSYEKGKPFVPLAPLNVGNPGGPLPDYMVEERQPTAAEALAFVGLLAQARRKA